MTLLEIFIILIGLLIVLLSFFIGKINEDTIPQQHIYTNEEIEMMEQVIKKKLDTVSANSVSGAEEALDKLCNEKIMAVDEFSSQVLERIEHNNSEVIFLYHMFQQKEEEIKNLMHQMDAVRREASAILERTSLVKKDSEKISSSDIGQAETANLSSASLGKIGNDDDIQELDFERNKESIIKLYQQKKSVIEISKQLGIGQGEVKLIIDLYGH